MSEKATGWGLDAEMARYFNSQWVPDETRWADPDVSPLHAADVTRLPAALIITAEHDPLRDEGEAFADRLRRAGVAVRVRVTGSPAVSSSTPWPRPRRPSRLQAASVHFTPGARTAWHTHPYGQTIYVIEGVGRCQRRGGAVEVIAPGDSVYFEPGEDHWHGAAPNRLMTHIAMQEVDETGSGWVAVTWGEHVTDEQYAAAPT